MRDTQAAPHLAPEMRVLPGDWTRLGATWDGAGVNMAVFSAHASRVELCLFDRDGRRETARIPLPERTHEIFHGYFPDLRPGQLYGLRAHGPYEPRAGHRFNANKLLLDPYARALRGDIRWHDALHGYRVGHRDADLSFDRRDSASAMPKCVIVDPAHTWGPRRRATTPWEDTVIYEAHVKGMTATREDVSPDLRGTFAGLATPGVIDHLRRLGVTAVELMPIQAFFDDRYLVERGLKNYWGYSTLGFFAPAPRYLAPGHGIEDFKIMVQRLHDAGIEVILDVVYNHTAEGNHMGPTLSFRGLDNASYYTLADDPRYYYDTTGCGANVNMRHPRVLQMVTDSLRYWVRDCGVDGFRFDLCSTLARNRDAFDIESPFLTTLAQDPILSRVKLISESWDLGVNGYQVGGFPPGWAEWNGRYRDDVRAYLKGDEGQVAGLAANLLGSGDIFDERGRRPWASVNFLTAHDGFTLADLYAYNAKHNEANGEDSRDGHNDNRSWNCGAEGETDDPAIMALRLQMRRFAMATMMVSQGTPMILMGDEIGRSQGGNNNAYCQDSPIAWMDWSDNPDEQAFCDFTAGLIRLRHQVPLLGQPRYLHGAPDVRWLRADGAEMTPEDWGNGLARSVGLWLEGSGGAALVLANAHHDSVIFQLPAGPGDAAWRLRLDTETGNFDPAGPGRPGGESVEVKGRSLVVLSA